MKRKFKRNRIDWMGIFTCLLMMGGVVFYGLLFWYLVLGVDWALTLIEI